MGCVISQAVSANNFLLQTTQTDDIFRDSHIQNQNLELKETHRVPLEEQDQINNILSPMNIVEEDEAVTKLQLGKTPTQGLLGKEKYITSYGALVMDDRSSSNKLQGLLLLYCLPDTNNIVFSYWEALTDNVYVSSFTDDQLRVVKEAAGVLLPWAPFFKSLASDMIKSKAVVTSTQTKWKDATFTIVSTKDPTQSYPFTVSLKLRSRARSSNAMTKFTYVMEPISRKIQQCRLKNDDRAAQVGRLECETMVKKAHLAQFSEESNELLVMLQPLREESASHTQKTMMLAREVRDLERHIGALSNENITKHPLDVLYDEGGAQYFQHVSWSAEHHPYEEEPDDTLSACIRAAFPLPGGANLSNISEVLERPDIKKRIDNVSNRSVIVEAFEIFKGIDQWSYDTIQLEIITNGNALFYTTYLLMYKLNLVSHFGIDDQVLRNFLVAVQSSYHPNPYHNGMHAADVTQINYYIMMIAGLSDKCKLGADEIFAGLIAAAVHDFDHPGFNNNFHTRTNAYLATFYNDRSILENHHLACTFELLRNPRHNILASLDDTQRQVFREIVVEMILATDMSNHGKIFKQFQVRMSETTDWHSSKEDVRLALCMSLKMADVSNCARPNNIYTEWAQNISKEFYIQGDAERSLQLSISPFMDRTKEKQEFPQGQISFIMYIVQPMVEAFSELLPHISFALQLCNENKEYWRQKSENQCD